MRQYTGQGIVEMIQTNPDLYRGVFIRLDDGEFVAKKEQCQCVDDRGVYPLCKMCHGRGYVIVEVN